MNGGEESHVALYPFAVDLSSSVVHSTRTIVLEHVATGNNGQMSGTQHFKLDDYSMLLDSLSIALDVNIYEKPSSRWLSKFLALRLDDHPAYI